MKTCESRRVFVRERHKPERIRSMRTPIIARGLTPRSAARPSARVIEAKRSSKRQRLLMVCIGPFVPRSIPKLRDDHPMGHHLPSLRMVGPGAAAVSPCVHGVAVVLGLSLGSPKFSMIER